MIKREVVIAKNSAQCFWGKLKIGVLLKTPFEPFMVQAWIIYCFHFRHGHRSYCWRRRTMRSERRGYWMVVTTPRPYWTSWRWRGRRPSKAGEEDQSLCWSCSGKLCVSSPLRSIPWPSAMWSLRLRSVLWCIPKAAQLTPWGRLTRPVQEALRYDSIDHLPRMTKVKVVYKECQKPSFRCICWKKSWHAECFFTFWMSVYLKLDSGNYEYCKTK
jgi:hypothetical protein